MRIGFNVRRLKGVHGVEWQGELIIPRELVEYMGAPATRQAMRVRGMPSPDQLQALLNAADYAERLADTVPDQVLPTKSISKARQLVAMAAADKGRGGGGGGGSKPRDKLKKAGKGLLKVGKGLIKSLF